MTLTLLLETLTSEQVAASILEFPHWRVEAETREAAISQLQTTFLKRLKYIETVPWDVPLPTSEPSWMPFAGTFSNDPDFAAIKVFTVNGINAIAFSMVFQSPLLN